MVILSEEPPEKDEDEIPSLSLTLFRTAEGTSVAAAEKKEILCYGMLPRQRRADFVCRVRGRLDTEAIFTTNKLRAIFSTTRRSQV
jgi:hypothetical protein